MKWTTMAIAAVLLAAGCGERRPVQTGDGGGGDVGSWPDLWNPRDGLVPGDLGVPGRDLVVSRIILPTVNTAATIGRDYNGDGKIDNGLGSILAALSGLSKSMNMQGTIDGAVNSGVTLLLLRLKARDYTNAQPAALWSWVARTTKCCSSPYAPQTCRQQALQGCFSGSHTFSAVAGSASSFSGSISAGRLRFGPAGMRLRFAVSSIGVIDLTLKQAYVTGRYDGTKIRDGVLAGVVERSDLQQQVVPAVGSMLNAALADPNVDYSTKQIIKTIFDDDKDGTISTKEVSGNALLKPFLGGDVDVDNDGLYELSLGLQFEAVPAKIKL